jgi:hypothetical protein
MMDVSLANFIWIPLHGLLPLAPAHSGSYFFNSPEKIRKYPKKGVDKKGW